jgi:parallel beta-helix repeat protein
MAPLRLLPVIALLALSGVAAAAGQSPPAGLECGDTITADTVLDHDLTGCPSNGLVIGANNITLDLHGHTISGDGKLVRRCPRQQICDVGVANDDRSGVTVRNGSVRGFAMGVGVFRVRDNRLVKLTSSHNQWFGFVIANSSGTVLRDSTATDNPRPDGDGLGVFFSHDLRIVGNEFRRNGQIGIHLEKSTRNLVKGNEFVDNGDFGVFVQADGNQIRGNRCVRGGAGILVGPGSRNVIAGNRVKRSEEGIAVEKGRGNVVTRNVVVRTKNSGIRLGIEDPPIGSTGTVVRRNLVIGAGDDGFWVAPHDRRALLVRNVARASGDEGFDIDSPSARLRGNRAL